MVTVKVEAYWLSHIGGSPVQPLVLNFNTGQVYDSSGLNFSPASASAYALGYEFNETRTLEFTFWQVQNFTTGFTVAGDNAVLAGDSADHTLVAVLDFVGLQRLGIHAGDVSSQIQNMELNYFNATIYSRFRVLGGVRYLTLRDNFDLRLSQTDTGDPTGNIISQSDYTINSVNRLLGGQIGLAFKQNIDLFAVEFMGKAGTYNNSVTVNSTVGDQNNTPPPLRQEQAKGNNLAFLGEMDLSGTYTFSTFLVIRAGYHVMWLNNVSLSTDYIDFSANNVGMTGVSIPVIHDRDLFMHGAHVGLEGRF